MDLLLITNLYPPQELGGYGRCMADFSWGLLQRGHRVQVLCHNAPYLGAASHGPSGEAVSRCLSLKGSFEHGLQIVSDPEACRQIDATNQQLIQQWLNGRAWDGILLGNLDLIGPEVLPVIVASGRPVLHHIGFVTPPYAPQQQPQAENYTLLAASQAVQASLMQLGFGQRPIPVIYPGARVDLFQRGGQHTLCLGPPKGTPDAPLKLCYAGLIMSTKGVHTFVEALIRLHQEGIRVQANLAGGTFGAGYKQALEQMIAAAGLAGEVRFMGQLNRPQLARFLQLHHGCVFPSIHPEAFGIVGAEAMASGLALVSSGVGGAGELVDDGETGLLFEAGNSQDLCRQLKRLVYEPGLLASLRKRGPETIRARFSVDQSVGQLEALLHNGG